MSKPLTKEERSSIAEYLQYSHLRTEERPAWIDRALEAEAYWRETVKNLKWPFIWTNTSGELACPFCEAEEPKRCKPECPWKLAQE